MPARKDTDDTVEVVITHPAGTHSGLPEFPVHTPAGAKVSLPRELAERLLEQGHAVKPAEA